MYLYASLNLTKILCEMTKPFDVSRDLCGVLNDPANKETQHDRSANENF